MPRRFGSRQNAAARTRHGNPGLKARVTSRTEADESAITSRQNLFVKRSGTNILRYAERDSDPLEILTVSILDTKTRLVRPLTMLGPACSNAVSRNASIATTLFGLAIHRQRVAAPAACRSSPARRRCSACLPIGGENSGTRIHAAPKNRPGDSQRSRRARAEE